MDFQKTSDLSGLYPPSAKKIEGKKRWLMADGIAGDLIFKSLYYKPNV